MARIETWYEQDLKKPVLPQYLEGRFFSFDNVGNLVGVNVYDNGSPATLSGSVTGYCVLQDGTTVQVNGTRSGNKVYILLPQSALSVPGTIGIGIKLVDSTTITTLLKLVATVDQTQTGNTVTPSQQVITDWSNAISAALQEVEDASAAQDAKIDDLNGALKLSDEYNNAGTELIGDNNKYKKTLPITWNQGDISWADNNFSYDTSNAQHCYSGFIDCAEFDTAKDIYISIPSGIKVLGLFTDKNDGTYTYISTGFSESTGTTVTFHRVPYRRYLFMRAWKTPLADIVPSDLWEVKLYTIEDTKSQAEIDRLDTRVSDLESGYEILNPTYMTKLFYANGNTASTEHTDAFGTDKLTAPGLYIVTFPDAIKCTYNYYNEHTGSRTNFDNCAHPFCMFNTHDFVRFAFYRKDGANFAPTDELAQQIKIYRLYKPKSNYDIAIAASDSTDNDKWSADIVLDGTNDSRVLCAIFGCNESINALLKNGNYHLTEIWTMSSYAKAMLPFNQNLYGNGTTSRRYICVRGATKSNPSDLCAVKFLVSQTLHESLTASNTNYFCIGSVYDYGTTQVTRLSTSCDIENINIIGWYYDKPITYVDTTRCLSTMLTSVNVSSWATQVGQYTHFAETPNVECCGIRVGRGSNYGIQNFVKNSNIWFCGKGFAINGEHFIIEDVKCHHNLVGIYVGDKRTVGVLEHPNIFIGCAIEGCKRSIVLSKQGVTTEQDFVEDIANGIVHSTIIFIGTSTELVWTVPTNETGGGTQEPTLPMLEIIRGCYRGRIEIDKATFAEGSGANIVLTSYGS